ncbi:MAG: DMT family transporter [Lachnospiraceae bacterium]
MLKRIGSSGTFWMIVSVFSFSFMQLFVGLTNDKVSVYQQILVRNLLGMFISAYIIKRDHLSWFGTKKEQPFLFGRSFFGFLVLISFFYATRNGNIADAAIINRTNPFFTTIFSVLFLKQYASKAQWLALIVVFIGGVIAGNPSFDSSAFPMLCALISSVCTGITYTILGHFKGKVPTMTVIMHFSTFCVFGCIPFLIKNFYVPSLKDVFVLLMIALLGNLGQIAITLAYRLSPATEIAVYDQLSVVISIILGWIFLQQVPSIRTWIGGGIVILASIGISIYHNKCHELEVQKV